MSTPSPTPAPRSPLIGVFDSGVGGLTVLRELQHLLPGAPLHYLADAAYAPYGTRTPAEIRERSLLIAEHLRAQGAGLIVVACNTATAHAIDALRARWPDMPFVGTEPGIKPAVATSRNGRIGVLATPATAASSRLRGLIARHGGDARVQVQACPGIVEHIEAGDLDSPALRALVAAHCAPLKAAGVDTVLLGCTHYPFITPLWQAELGPEVSLLRIETAVARRAAELWLGKASSGPAAAPVLDTSGDPIALRRWIRDVLGWPQAIVRAWQPGNDNGQQVPAALKHVVPGTGLEPVLPSPEGGF